VLALTTFGVASGYLAGARAGHMLWLASVLLAVILFGVGLAHASGQRAAAIATMVAVGLIVGVFLPSTPATDLRATAEIGAGGLWALLLCPWRSPQDGSPAPQISKAGPRAWQRRDALCAACRAEARQRRSRAFLKEEGSGAPRTERGQRPPYRA
jgi:hypothetical protein